MNMSSSAERTFDFPLTVGVVLYEGFELLDVYGPLEMLGLLPDYFQLNMIAENEGLVKSTQGPKSATDAGFTKDKQYDILLIPGGHGTLHELNNKTMLEYLKHQSKQARFVASVCTGSALLAKAGLLDGKRATTNKLYFERMKPNGPLVNWVAEARWVEDGKFFTSSGVSAGIDMTLGLIAHILGKDTAQQVATGAEYSWHDDASFDPFAKIHNLV